MGLRTATTAAAVLAVFAAGCFSSLESDGAGDPNFQDDNDGGGAGSPPDLLACSVDADCVPASSTCCGCPTFAIAVQPSEADSCEEIPCPDVVCSAQSAVCIAGECELRCDPLITTQSCAFGFVVDEAGCDIDACAANATAPQCDVDVDCTLAPADCCDCTAGGSTTAVAVTEIDAHNASLSCEGPLQCPGVDTCEPTAAAVCRFGRCAVSTESSMLDSVTLCGVSDTPPCPAGESCVLNDPEAAASGVSGVGVCRPL